MASTVTLGMAGIYHYDFTRSMSQYINSNCAILSNKLRTTFSLSYIPNVGISPERSRIAPIQPQMRCRRVWFVMLQCRNAYHGSSPRRLLRVCVNKTTTMITMKTVCPQFFDQAMQSPGILLNTIISIHFSRSHDPILS